MKIIYDKEVDALSIVFRDATVTTQEWAEGVCGEYDANGRLVGIEILDAKQHFGDLSSIQQISLEGVGQLQP